MIRFTPVLFLAGLTSAHGTHDPVSAPVKTDASRRLIYFDWVENGELRGGVLEVDPTNPLMAHDASVKHDVSKTVNSVTTLMDNGPTSNRIDFAFLGDGYTVADLPDYALHVDSILPTFFAEHPFDVYETFFNVHRVDVVSAQSGVDNDPTQGVMKNTALDMGYWCGGTERLLCLDVGKAKAHANAAPGNDQIIALANSTKYGGAGYPGDDIATLAGNNFSSIEIALHEIGHSLGNLADEYTYGGPATYQGPEPFDINLSKKNATSMANQEAKWHLWLDEPQVDTFEGGGYSVFGIYRPTNNSLMRNLGRPFQQVNSEAMVIEFYKIVRPIDDASPEGPYEGAAALFVDPVDPVGHALDIQWFADGEELPGQTGEVLDVATLGLADDIYEFTVRVVDNTTLVRDEDARSQWMTEERSWIMYTGIGEAPPVVTNANGIQAANLDQILVNGSFLDDVTEARIDGVPANITGQGADFLKIRPTVAGAPGFPSLELTGPAGTFTYDGVLKQYPTLAASSTGPGGELTATFEKDAFTYVFFLLFYGLDTLPTPVPTPPAHYGLLLNPAAPFGYLLSGVVDPEVYDLVLPVPDDPALAGLELHLQAYVQTGFFFGTFSWSNFATATL